MKPDLNDTINAFNYLFGLNEEFSYNSMLETVEIHEEEGKKVYKKTSVTN